MYHPVFRRCLSVRWHLAAVFTIFLIMPCKYTHERFLELLQKVEGNILTEINSNMSFIVIV